MEGITLVTAPYILKMQETSNGPVVLVSLSTARCVYFADPKKCIA